MAIGWGTQDVTPVRRHTTCGLRYHSARTLARFCSGPVPPSGPSRPLSGASARADAHARHRRASSQTARDCLKDVPCTDRDRGRGSAGAIRAVHRDSNRSAPDGPAACQAPCAPVARANPVAGDAPRRGRADCPARHAGGRTVPRRVDRPAKSTASASNQTISSRHPGHGATAQSPAAITAHLLESNGCSPELLTHHTIRPSREW